MKGQAFVSFADEKSAEFALKETNCYVLFGKPLVVVSLFFFTFLWRRIKSVYNIDLLVLSAIRSVCQTENIKRKKNYKVKRRRELSHFACLPGDLFYLKYFRTVRINNMALSDHKLYNTTLFSLQNNFI